MLVVHHAWLNLPQLVLKVYFQMLQGDYMEAYELIKSLEPSIPQEYVLKAIVNVVIGQETNVVSANLVKMEFISWF